MAHKIVAFRLKGTHTGIIIDALTESPRGTRVIAGSRTVEEAGRDRQQFAEAVEDAFKSLTQPAV